MMARPAKMHERIASPSMRALSTTSMKLPQIHTMTPCALTHRLRATSARHLLRALQMVIALTAAGAMALPTIALGADTASKSARQAATQPTKKKGSLKIKHQRSPSEETSAERDRRLTRECKGAPNAGACLGYTRK